MHEPQERGTTRRLWTPESRRLLAFFAAVGALALAYLWTREPPPLTPGSACYLRTWSLRQRPVRFRLESGGVVHVPTATACVVIEDDQERTLVRVTEGPYKGITGWASRASVGK